MNVARISLTLFLFGTLIPTTASAAVPKKRLPHHYETLWTNSPFTSKPIEPSTSPPPNPVEDYTLAGLSRVEDGWFVVLIHKIDRSKRIRLSPHQCTASGFGVVAIEHPTTRQVRVKIEAEGQSAWVQFEPKFLTLRKKEHR